MPLIIASESGEFATGTPLLAAQIVRGLQPYLEAGQETIIWNVQSNHLPDFIEQMHLATEEVIPSIQAG